MENHGDLLNKFNKILERDQYIFQPYTYLNEKFDEAYEAKIDLECIALIIEHNKSVIESMTEIHNDMCNIIDSARDINEIEDEVEEQEEDIFGEEIEEKPTYENYDSYVDVLLYALDNNNLDTQVSELTSKQIPTNSLKFAIYKRIKLIEQDIKISITHNVLNNITKQQNTITKLKSLLNLLKEDKQEEIIEQKESKYNIIFIPNNKNQLYIYDDISKYLENAKEIKTALDKIYSGYVMEAKNIKSIEGKNEKLYEYKTPSGLRIMFIINGNNLFISLLFYKDKQRSTKIDLLYDEAIKRYQNNEEVLLSNINNPNFILDQAELLGNLYTLLDERTLKLSKGV